MIHYRHLDRIIVAWHCNRWTSSWICNQNKLSSSSLGRQDGVYLWIVPENSIPEPCIVPCPGFPALQPSVAFTHCGEVTADHCGMQHAAHTCRLVVLVYITRAVISNWCIEKIHSARGPAMMGAAMLKRHRFVRSGHHTVSYLVHAIGGRNVYAEESGAALVDIFKITNLVIFQIEDVWLTNLVIFQIEDVWLNLSYWFHECGWNVSQKTVTLKTLGPSRK